MLPDISIIVPLYNEAEVFQALVQSLGNILDHTKEKIEVILVDDGSTDNTSFLMRQLALVDTRYQCIFLSRNFGHQMAITAGLAYTNAAQGVMIMDGDMQDPPEMIHQFLDAYREGYDVVYSIRMKREVSLLRKMTYKMYYRILKTIARSDTNLDSGDFCFLSRRVVDILNKMPEEQRYLRGMRSWVGFSQKGIEYNRPKRLAGRSKYSLGKLLRLAYMGIFNFSEFPIKFITVLGMIVTGGGIAYFIITVLRKFIYGDVPSGFTALIGAIVVFSGVQLISIGIIGEYVVRIFYQVKKRPLFLVRERIINGEVMADQPLQNDIPHTR